MTQTNITEIFAQHRKEFRVNRRELALAFDHAFVVFLHADEILFRLQHGEDRLEDFELIGFDIKDIVEELNGAIGIMEILLVDGSHFKQVFGFFIVFGGYFHERITRRQATVPIILMFSDNENTLKCCR